MTADIRKPRRSLVLREAYGITETAAKLQARIGVISSKGGEPMIQHPHLLHCYITALEDHLVQLKTLLTYKGKSP